MEQTKLQISYTEGHPVTKEQLLCFVRQLSADLQRKNPIIKWKQRGKDHFYTNGLSEGSRIEIYPCEGGVTMCYTKNGEKVYSAVEIGGSQYADPYLANLYRLVSTTVRERDLVGRTSSISQKAIQHRLLVGDIFRSADVTRVLSELMDKPSRLSLTISAGSPEWNRRKDLVSSIVTFIQQVERKPNGLILDGSWLRYPDGTLYPTPIPMVRLANAYTIIPDKEYGGLHPAEKNVKFVADIVADLVLGL